MTQRTRFLGLDVHKQSIAVAIVEEAGRPEPFGTIANDPAALRKLVKASAATKPFGWLLPTRQVPRGLSSTGSWRASAWSAWWPRPR